MGTDVLWTIKKPTTSALDAFDTCRSGVTDLSLINRLQIVRPMIASVEVEFEIAAIDRTDHLIATATNVGAVSKAEMEMLYTRHFARAKSRGRHIYDDLMMAASNDICPFCGHRSVSTLDHTLPKTRHPALVVTPINLVPCCKDCNHRKGERAVNDVADQWLNAYYDDVADDRWLYATIIEGSPPVAVFSVAAPQDWDEIMSTRVGNHFNRLGLAKLYASQAGRQFQNARRALGEMYDAAGVDAVREDLYRRYRSCSDITVNSWEVALYQAAAQSDWYCNGGFKS